MTDSTPGNLSPNQSREDDDSNRSGVAPLSASADKKWATLSHIGGLIGILPSLIIFLVFKDRGPRTRQEAKEALNWQITFTLGYIALWIVVSIINMILIAAGALALTSVVSLLPVLWWVFNIVVSVIGGVKVNSGTDYRYPASIRLIK